MHHHYRAFEPQLLKPECPEPMLRSKRGLPLQPEWALLAMIREGLCSNEDPAQPEIIFFFKDRLQDFLGSPAV